MIELIIGIFSSTGFGTVIGLVGSWITRYEERKNRQIAFENEYKMAQLDAEVTKSEQAHQLAMADKQMEAAEVESKIVVDKGELSAFRDSIVHGSNKSGVSWVDGFNSLMRPLITLFLLGVSGWYTYTLMKLYGGLGGMGASEMGILVKHTIYTVFFLTSTAVTWWFGARPTKDYKGK
jgi:hypothetical protein